MKNIGSLRFSWCNAFLNISNKIYIMLFLNCLIDLYLPAIVLNNNNGHHCG